MTGYTEKQLLKLVGCKIVGVVKDSSDPDVGVIYGLKFDKGLVAFILSDEEGNGPGYLEIVKGS